MAWADVEGEKAASTGAQNAAKNLANATEQHRRQHLIITALEQELAIVDRHISEAQVEHQKIEDIALRLAHNALEEAWNEAAQALLDVGGKLYAAAQLIGRDPVSLMKLHIPAFHTRSARDVTADSLKQPAFAGCLTYPKERRHERNNTDNPCPKCLKPKSFLTTPVKLMDTRIE